MGRSILWLALAYALADHRASKRQVVQAVLDGRKVGCTIHTGNFLLLWSDGSVNCYQCGREKHGSK